MHFGIELEQYTDKCEVMRNSKKKAYNLIIMQENDAIANVWGFKRPAVYVIGSTNKRGKAYAFYIYFLFH